MSDNARWYNIEPMYKAKIASQAQLIDALRAKIRVLEDRDSNWDVRTEFDETIEKQTAIYDSEIVDE